MELLSIGLLPMSPHCITKGLGSFNTNCHCPSLGLPLFPKLVWIWFLLPKHSKLPNLLILCPVPQPTQLRAKFLSRNDCPTPIAITNGINHQWMEAACHHLDADSLFTPTRGLRRHQGPRPPRVGKGGSEMPPQPIGAAAGHKGSPKASRTTPSSASLASLFHFTSNTPALAHTASMLHISIYPFHCPPPPPPLMTLPSWANMGQGAA